MASHPAVLAREAYHKGDYRLAERLFHSLCSQEPEEPVWHLDLATLCITLIRYEEAEEALRLAAACGAGSTEIMRQIALCYFSMYRFGEARRILEPAAEAGHLPCLLGMLQVMEREGLIEETVELLERALQQHPAHPELRLLRAQVLVRQGQLEAAEALARALLRAGMPFLLNSKAAYLLAAFGYDEEPPAPPTPPPSSAIPTLTTTAARWRRGSLPPRPGCFALSEANNVEIDIRTVQTPSMQHELETFPPPRPRRHHRRRLWKAGVTSEAFRFDRAFAARAVE